MAHLSHNVKGFSYIIKKDTTELMDTEPECTWRRMVSEGGRMPGPVVNETIQPLVLWSGNLAVCEFV